MTKGKKSLDKNQICLDFDSPIEAYQALREELTRATPPPVENAENRWDEYSTEIAVAIKKIARDNDMSRDHLVDAINDFFGFDGTDGRKSLTIHMLNNHLSRPAEYPLPLPYVHAINRIFQSTELIDAMAVIEGARAIGRDEIKMLALGKIDNALAELQRLKKTLRGK